MFQSGVDMWNMCSNDPEKQLKLIHISKNGIKEEILKINGLAFIGREYCTDGLEEYVGIFYASGENENCLF